MTDHRGRVLNALDRFYASQRKRPEEREGGPKSALAQAIVGALPLAPPKPPWPADQLALVLVLEDRGALSIGELVEALGKSQSVTSVLVDRAEAAGHVQRFRAQFDHRITLVGLTPAAIQERKKAPASRTTTGDG